MLSAFIRVDLASVPALLVAREAFSTAAVGRLAPSDARRRRWGLGCRRWELDPGS